MAGMEGHGQGSLNSVQYAVDIVFCIDATESMDPILDSVKENAIHFYSDFQAVMDRKHKRVDQLRVRVIAFRDYLADGPYAMLVTDFFRLPDQSEELEACIRSIKAEGGGDDPEDGFEALAYAIKSDWNRDQGVRKRHVIVLWSDDAAHEIGYGRAARNYPDGMARDFAQLTDWWTDEMDDNAKRLLLFAPRKESWLTLRNNWDNVIHYESDVKGLADRDYQEILDAISNTI